MVKNTLLFLLQKLRNQSDNHILTKELTMINIKNKIIIFIQQKFKIELYHFD